MNKDGVTGAVENIAELVLALPQGVLGALSLGDVPGEAVDKKGTVRQPPLNSGIHAEPYAAAPEMAGLVFEVFHFAPLSNRSQELLPPFRVNIEVPAEIPVIPHCLLWRGCAQGTGHLRIDPMHPALGIRLEDPHWRVLKDPAILFLAFAEDLIVQPLAFQMLQAAAQLRLGPVHSQEFLGGEVVGVLVAPIANNHDGMRVEHIEDDLRLEAPHVVLAQSYDAAMGKDPIQFGLVFHEPLRAGHSPQGPAHLTGNAQSGVSLTQGLVRLLPDQDNHGLWIEAIPLEVCFPAGCQNQLTGSGVNICGDSLLAQKMQNGLRCTGIRNVKDLVTLLQSAPDKRSENSLVLRLVSINTAQVIPRRNALDRCHRAVGMSLLAIHPALEPDNSVAGLFQLGHKLGLGLILLLAHTHSLLLRLNTLSMEERPFLPDSTQARHSKPGSDPETSKDSAIWAFYSSAVWPVYPRGRTL